MLCHGLRHDLLGASGFIMYFPMMFSIALAFWRSTCINHGLGKTRYGCWDLEAFLKRSYLDC